MVKLIKFHKFALEIKRGKHIQNHKSIKPNTGNAQ